MWDGFAAVDNSYSPPIYEGIQTFVTIFNSGPGTVSVEIWDNLPPNLPNMATQNQHQRAVQIRAGDIRTITAAMIVVRFLAEPPIARPYAAVGWRLTGITK